MMKSLSLSSTSLSVIVVVLGVFLMERCCAEDGVKGLKDIIFSEIFPDPTTGDRAAFIELFNPTNVPLSLFNYKVCSFDEVYCTDLVGVLPVAGYFTLCRDISQYPFCNVGTAIPLKSLNGLYLIKPNGDILESISWTPRGPSAQSYARGLNKDDLLAFTWTMTPTNGFGFLGGAVPTMAPITMATPPETPMPVTSRPTTLKPSPSPTSLCAVAFCHSRADCNIIDGKAKCTCKTGFAGDGQFVCNDIDECTQIPSPCSAEAGFCVNEFGSFKCGCGKGYTEISKGVCQDINECLDATKCGPNTLCVNIPGSFTCTCKDGYSGDDPIKVGCTDINECIARPGPCSTNAACTNTIGGFTCKCNTGFTGDGLTCALTDNCASKPCHPNAICTNTVTGASCKCKPGFAGNGITTCSSTPTLPPPTISPMPSSRSNPPSSTPSTSFEPSISTGPSLTKMPSEEPSLSNTPSFTESPSGSPSISDKPSVTDMPSAVPSLSDSPTR